MAYGRDEFKRDMPLAKIGLSGPKFKWIIYMNLWMMKLYLLH